MNLLIVAFDKARVNAIVTAVTVLRSLVVHLITLRVGGPTGGTPQQLALIVVSPTRTLIAKSLAHVASLTVHLEHVRWTIFALTGAVLRQVALMLDIPTFCASALRLASLQVATFTGCAARVTVQHAGGYVTARIVAVLLQAAITLFARLDKSVAAYGAVEQLLRFVPQAVIHTVLEGKS